MTLSNKIEIVAHLGYYDDAIITEDVKQFIKDLKEEIKNIKYKCGNSEICEKIEVLKMIIKLAGDKLGRLER